MLLLLFLDRSFAYLGGGLGIIAAAAAASARIAAGWAVFIKRNYYAAVVVNTDGVGGDAADVLYFGMDDPSLIGAHGLESDLAVIAENLRSHAACKTAQGLLTSGAVALDIKSHLDMLVAVLVGLAVSGEIDEVLKRLKGIAVMADKDSRILAVDGDHTVSVGDGIGAELGISVESEVVDQSVYKAQSGDVCSAYTGRVCSDF